MTSRNSLSDADPNWGHSPATCTSSCLEVQAPSLQNSNRHTPELEFPITHSKQTIASLSNRHISRVMSSANSPVTRKGEEKSNRNTSGLGIAATHSKQSALEFLIETQNVFLERPFFDFHELRSMGREPCRWQTVPLPSGGKGCRLFVYDELLPERCVLLQLLLLLLRVYVRVLWHGEAGKLETESSPGITSPPPETNWQAGFLFLRRRGVARMRQRDRKASRRTIRDADEATPTRARRNAAGKANTRGFLLRMTILTGLSDSSLRSE
jgi:hypothetical protein